MNEMTKTLAGVVLGAIGLTVVAGFLFYSEKVKVERSLVNPVSHCPVTESKTVWSFYKVHPPSILKRTAVLIDATDHIPESHRHQLASWFEEDFTNTLVQFEQVAIYEVRPQKNSANPVLDEPHFNQCSPPSVANKWIENPRLVRMKFKEEFMERKLSVIRALASQDEARWSPIMEIVEILFNDFDRIVLVSDLMQHTTSCSLYKRRDSKGSKKLGCLTDSLMPLDTKSLDVIFLKRNKITALQDSSLLNFWQEHIEARQGTFLVKAQLSSID